MVGLPTKKQDALGTGMRTWLTCRAVQGKRFNDDLWGMCFFVCFVFRRWRGKLRNALNSNMSSGMAPLLCFASQP